MTAIELRNASRWYGNVVAVNDVSCTLGAGITGLLGPNGAGKTTVLHMMAGLLQPSAGHVLIDLIIGSMVGAGATVIAAGASALATVGVQAGQRAALSRIPLLRGGR